MFTASRLTHTTTKARVFFAGILLITLTACGFQLRGVYQLPFNTLYIALPESGEFHAQLKRAVEAGSQTKVVLKEKDANAILRVVNNAQEKRILSTNSSGKVREYELIRLFAFQLVDKDNVALLPLSQISLRRDITYSDSVVLAKEAEEILLWRDMQNDLVQQILRRLAAARPRTDEAGDTVVIPAPQPTR
jgi:LPS-assembly lipoprotein